MYILHSLHTHTYIPLPFLTNKHLKTIYKEVLDLYSNVEESKHPVLFSKSLETPKQEEGSIGYIYLCLRPILSHQ